MSDTEPTLRQVLANYSHKRASDHAVWRAVVSHRQWLLPLFELEQHYQVKECDKLYMLQGELRPREGLVLYSDKEAAECAEAAGLDPGPVAGAFAGDLLFNNLAPDWNAILINPGSEPSQQMALRASAGHLRQLASAWVGVAHLERAIESAAHPASPDLLRKLQGYREFMVLIDTATNGLTTIRNFLPGLPNGIVAFTAPDCREKMLNVIPGGLSGKYKNASIEAERLLTPVAWADGVVLNPLGPGPVWGLPWTMMASE